MAIDEDLLYRQIGRALRQGRERQGFTQAELAARIGLQRSSIVNAEAGRQRLPLHTIYRLCQELRLEVIDVFPSLTDLTVQQEDVTIAGEDHRVPHKTATFLRSVLNEDRADPQNGPPKETDDRPMP